MNRPPPDDFDEFRARIPAGEAVHQFTLRRTWRRTPAGWAPAEFRWRLCKPRLFVEAADVEIVEAPVDCTNCLVRRTLTP